MAKEKDQNIGLVKTHWHHIRDRVAKVEPAFAKLVDELDPGQSFPLYLAYYPYGMTIADTKSPFMPNSDGTSYRLSDPSVPKDVMKHLGYGQADCPFGMVLEKTIEYFIDLKDDLLTLPRRIQKPGSCFSFLRNLNERQGPWHGSNNVFTISSGARSAFLLPNIGCATNHSHLQADFNIQLPPPKSMYAQWGVMREIFNSSSSPNNWYSCILYFSESWIKKLNHDKAWVYLKTYLYDSIWRTLQYNLSHFHRDVIYSIIQKKRNLKPNPYLIDTAKHLFATALGSVPGYAPSLNDDLLPHSLFSKVFIESYGLKKYYPTIMEPMHYNFLTDKFPIYYSLQYPSTIAFSPKAREISSTLLELRELAHIVGVIKEELSNSEICQDSILSTIAKQIDFNYFHNKSDRHRIVQPSSNLMAIDKRFNALNNPKNTAFPSDAPFVRGCISIST